MLIYSKPLTADMQILWAVLRLCVPIHHTYSKVNARCPGFPSGRPGPAVHSMLKHRLLMQPVFIVPVQAAAQLLPVGRWA